MDPRRPPAGSPEPEPAMQPLSALFLILFARAIGYFALFLLAYIIAMRPAWDFSAADVLLWVCAIAIPFARRRAEIRYGSARQGSRPPILQPLAGHVGVTALLWIVAQSVHVAA